MSNAPPWSYWYDKIHVQYMSNQKIKNFDTNFYIYRYITSSNELKFIYDTNIVFSVNPYGTYWTTLLTDDASEAQRLLALSRKPIYRVGGFPLANIDRGLIIYQGPVKPNNNQPGGAWEILIKGPVMITSKQPIS